MATARNIDPLNTIIQTCQISTSSFQSVVSLLLPAGAYTLTYLPIPSPFDRSCVDTPNDATRMVTATPAVISIPPLLYRKEALAAFESPIYRTPHRTSAPGFDSSNDSDGKVFFLPFTNAG